MTEFKVSDYVRVKGGSPMWSGLCGPIVEIRADEFPCVVDLGDAGHRVFAAEELELAYSREEEPAKEADAEFKIGDYIRVCDGVERVGGLRGKIVSDRRLSGMYAIEIEPPFEGHDCGGLTPSRRGWCVLRKHLERVEPAKEADAAAGYSSVIRRREVVEIGGAFTTGGGGRFVIKDGKNFVDLGIDMGAGVYSAYFGARSLREAAGLLTALADALDAREAGHG